MRFLFDIRVPPKWHQLVSGIIIFHLGFQIELAHKKNQTPPSSPGEIPLKVHTLNMFMARSSGVSTGGGVSGRSGSCKKQLKDGMKIMNIMNTQPTNHAHTNLTQSCIIPTVHQSTAFSSQQLLNW